MHPGGFRMQIEEKIIQFLFVESILIYIRNLQYRSDFPPPTSNGGKAKEIPSYPWCYGSKIQRRKLEFWSPKEKKCARGEVRRLKWRDNM
jgi:hypothetical protein